jgi:hypothetical protein
VEIARISGEFLARASCDTVRGRENREKDMRKQARNIIKWNRDGEPRPGRRVNVA